MPRRIAEVAGWVTMSALAIHDPGVARRALGDKALVVDQPGLVGAGFRRLLLGEHIGQQAGGLDVRPFPADVGDEITATPLRALASAAARIVALGEGDECPSAFPAWRKDMVAPRRAAGDLKVDMAEGTRLRATSSRRINLSAASPGEGSSRNSRAERASRSRWPRSSNSAPSKTSITS